MVVLNLGIAAVLARLPGRRARGSRTDTVAGGPVLRWVPDGRGGLRLAGNYLPDPDPHGPGPQRTNRRRGPRRSG
ncbi:MAG: hypothetical protein L0I76_02915 [Pseudonocardia sp.]|nr:hypothetical protein [Pseudonocardia sp.]